MVSERNRIINLISYLESLGIEINVGKNKAYGNKGYFKAVNDKFRIDIAKGLSDENVLRVLIHEFAHFIHYSYDKSLKSLDFLIKDISDDIWEEFISLTVDSIPKESIQPLYDAKLKLENEIDDLKNNKLNLYAMFELKQKQRFLKSINNKISRLNRYYNSPSELFARSMELYITNPETFKIKAPLLNEKYKSLIKNNIIPMMSNLVKY